jgi:hypothetical protein
MSHRYSDCKCWGCPEKDTAACRYRQSENQCKELLLERKILRESFVERARQEIKVAEQTPTNSDLMQLLRDTQAWFHRRGMCTYKESDSIGLRLDAVVAQLH